MNFDEIESKVSQFNPFQKKVLSKLLPLLKGIDPNILLKESLIRFDSRTIEIILSHTKGCVVVLLLETELLKINCGEIDYLFFDNMDMTKAPVLLENLLKGNYKIKKLLSHSGKTVQTIVEWDDTYLREFNLGHKKITSFFSRIESEIDEVPCSFMN